MDFDERLQRAIERGKRRGEQKRAVDKAKTLNEEELKQLHSKYRLQFSEYIEDCVKRLPNCFPGFRFETIYGERGWGAACSRDDIRMSSGKRTNDYSRLEMTIRPHSTFHVIDLAAKGTIRNKEVFNRNHYERITEIDPTTFIELIDVWVLEFAELYSVKK